MLADREFVARLLDSLVVDVLDPEELGWSHETDQLMAEAAGRFEGRDLAEVIRDFAPSDCDIRRVGFILEIVLNGYPGIHDVANTLERWLESDVEAEFRCSIAVQNILVIPVNRVNCVFDEALERKWPKYSAQIRSMRTQWSSHAQKRS